MGASGGLLEAWLSPSELPESGRDRGSGTGGGVPKTSLAATADRRWLGAGRPGESESLGSICTSPGAEAAVEDEADRHPSLLGRGGGAPWGCRSSGAKRGEGCSSDPSCEETSKVGFEEKSRGTTLWTLGTCGNTFEGAPIRGCAPSNCNPSAP